jgi:hypothetical protein
VDAAINTKAIHAYELIAYMGNPPSYQHTLSTPHSKEWEAVLKSKYNQLINTGTFEWVQHSPPGNWMVKVTSTSARSTSSHEVSRNSLISISMLPIVL